SPSSDPFPCSLSPTGSVLDGLGFAHSQQSRQLAWPNRVHLRCGLGVSHSVAPDHASRHRPYFVLLVLSRFNNAGLSPALISAPWRSGPDVLVRQIARKRLGKCPNSRGRRLSAGLQFGHLEDRDSAPYEQNLYSYRYPNRALSSVGAAYYGQHLHADLHPYRF